MSAGFRRGLVAVAACGCLIGAPTASAQAPRAFELVSPPGDGNYSASFEQLASGAEAVIFASDGEIAGTPASGGSGLNNVPQRLFSARRAASGWLTSSLTNFTFPDPAEVGAYDFIGTANDGSRTFFTSAEAIAGPTGGALNLYVTSPEGPPTLITHDEAGESVGGLTYPCQEGNFCELNGAAAVVSADGQHVVFGSSVPLTSAAGSVPLSEETSFYLYEADAAGTVSLVSAMSDGELPAGGHGAVLGALHASVADAVSEDGETVFFSSADQYDPGAPDTGVQIFMHRGAETRDVSASQTAEPGMTDALFDGASRDGSAVVFSDCAALTADDENTTLCEKGEREIYEYDAHSDVLTRVSAADEGLESLDGATYLATSQDGARVFFASEDQLDPDGPEVNPENREPFLYEYSAGSVHYIATLTRADLSRLTGYGPKPGQNTGAHGPIRVSPNGRYLVFESEADLTADDHNSEAERTNVFEYDTTTRELTRVSQGSLPGSGGGPHPATIGSQQQFPDYLEGGDLEQSPMTFGGEQLDGRAVTEAGAVFFSSREGLAAGATTGPLHVYEWSAGTTRLISPAGAAATDAHYLDNSADGTDVLFSTQQAILHADTDGEGVDIYDAREGGGFAEVEPGSCEGEGCLEDGAGAPSSERPISSLFKGSGNLPSTSGTGGGGKSKPLTRKQKLRKALSVCRRKHAKRARGRCEAVARKRFGAHAARGGKR